MPLSEAFEAQGIFPKIYTASILSGEKSGALDDVLARFVEYLKRSVGVSRKLRGALAYPAFLLFASGLMVAFLTLYIVPRMSDLFQGPEREPRPADDHRRRALAYQRALQITSIWLVPLILIHRCWRCFVWLQDGRRQTSSSQVSAEIADRRAS